MSDLVPCDVQKTRAGGQRSNVVRPRDEVTPMSLNPAVRAQHLRRLK